MPEQLTPNEERQELSQDAIRLAELLYDMYVDHKQEEANNASS